jgi:hypothetical protein
MELSALIKSAFFCDGSADRPPESTSPALHSSYDWRFREIKNGDVLTVPGKKHGRKNRSDDKYERP